MYYWLQCVNAVISEHGRTLQHTRQIFQLRCQTLPKHWIGAVCKSKDITIKNLLNYDVPQSPT